VVKPFFKHFIERLNPWNLPWPHKGKTLKSQLLKKPLIEFYKTQDLSSTHGKPKLLFYDYSCEFFFSSQSPRGTVTNRSKKSKMPIHYTKKFNNELRLGAQSVTLLSTLRDPTQLRWRQCTCGQKKSTHSSQKSTAGGLENFLHIFGKLTTPCVMFEWEKNKILIAHQKERIHRTKKVPLADKKSSARDYRTSCIFLGSWPPPMGCLNGKKLKFLFHIRRKE
jgi:hypothetical protein